MTYPHGAMWERHLVPRRSSLGDDAKYSPVLAQILDRRIRIGISSSASTRRSKNGKYFSDWNMVFMIKWYQRVEIDVYRCCCCKSWDSISGHPLLRISFNHNLLCCQLSASTPCRLESATTKRDTSVLKPLTTRSYKIECHVCCSPLDVSPA